MILKVSRLIAQGIGGRQYWVRSQVLELDVCYFFFQAEDGIRDLTVTGVQTCALPISCTDRMGQTLQVSAGQMVVYDPIAMRLENPVEVDLQQELNSPLISGFRPLPSSGLIHGEIQSYRQIAAPNGDLDRAVKAAGAASIATATPDQFMQAFNSLLVSYPQGEVRTLVAGAIRARPDLADRIRAAAAQVRRRRHSGYWQGGKRFT